MSTTTSAEVTLRVRVQKFGTFLSNMIMPNIGAIIAWGLITAFFIPDGWMPNEKIATMVGPTVTYLLPILIAYTGGRMVYDVRGGVVGAMSTMGVILATSDPLFVGDEGGSPMFIGAMIMGPLGGWVMKKLDALWAERIRPGFEMLVNNFSAGILAAVLAVASMFTLAPVLRLFIDWLGNAVNFLIDHDLLPLTSIFIEPAKVMFLNNAINHGVLTPLGVDQARETGKSVLFLLEANPGPGLGLLLAYMVFGKGVARASAPGAAIIHFFGGIHEIYFPYVLMKPRLIAAVVAGGMAGVFVNVLFDSGLRAPAAPGSIIAIYAQTASDSYVGVTLAVLAATVVSFVVAAFLLKIDRSTDEPDLAAATASMEKMKGRKSSVAGLTGASTSSDAGPINTIVFACDAGMGSSAMGASVLRRKVNAAGFDQVSVTNQAIANLTDEPDLVVTHQDLTERAQQRTPSAIHVSVDNFMNSPRYDEIVDLLGQRNRVSVPTGGESRAADADAAGPQEDSAENTEAGERAASSPATDVLPTSSIVLAGTASTRDDAISEAGRLLVEAGAVTTSYVDAMHEREASVSTHMGNLLAIPHGTNDAKADIVHTGLSFVRYPEGIDWNGKPTEFVIGIAGAGKDHMKLLNRIAKVFVDSEQVERLRAAGTVEEIRAVLEPE